MNLCYGESCQWLHWWRFTLTFDLECSCCIFWYEEWKLLITWKLLVRFWCSFTCYCRIVCIGWIKLGIYDPELWPRRLKLVEVNRFAYVVIFSPKQFYEIPRVWSESVKAVCHTGGTNTNMLQLHRWPMVSCCQHFRWPSDQDTGICRNR